MSWVGVKEGDYVKKYQGIASLDQREVRKTLDKYLLAYMDSRWSFETTKDASGDPAAMTTAVRRALDKAQFDLNPAVLDVELKDLSVQFSNLWTPIDGLVVRAESPVAGVNIIPTQAEFEIVNPKSVVFLATADQTEVPQISIGMPGSLVLDAFPDKAFPGKIATIAFSPKAGETGTVYAVKFNFSPDNTDYEYRLGMTGDLTFVTQEKKDVLFLPPKYISSSGSKHYVSVARIMNYLLFIVKSALDDFSRNKIRTALTSLGILIGISSVVLLMAMGLGLKKYISQQFESLGTGLIYILPGDLSSGAGFGTAVSGIKFDDKDVAAIKRIPKVSLVMPMIVKFAKAEANGQSKTVETIGSTTDIFPGMNLEIQYGSPFSRADQDKGGKKVVLGPKIAEKLFTNSFDAVDQIVKIDGQAYTVIGVTKPKGGGGLGTPSIDDHIFTSYKAAYSLVQDKKYYALYVKAGNDSAIAGIKSQARTLLLKRYKPDDFSVLDQTELLNTINSIFGVINSVLVAIAAISLVIGGIGIMNIMYVSVIERIREIGIRRAIGATGRDILLQFLAESVLLSLLGGLLGLGLAYLGVFLVQFLFPAYVDLLSIVLAVGVSSSIGITFGVFPAKKAADLSPMEAIRYE